MNILPKKIAPFLTLIVWLILVMTVIVLIFGVYVATRIQALNTTLETQRNMVQEPDVTDQITAIGVTEPIETEIKNDADLQNIINELDTTDLDELDALLEQNDLDTANF